MLSKIVQIASHEHGSARRQKGPKRDANRLRCSHSLVIKHAASCSTAIVALVVATVTGSCTSYWRLGCWCGWLRSALRCRRRIHNRHSEHSAPEHSQTACSSPNP